MRSFFLLQRNLVMMSRSTWNIAAWAWAVGAVLLVTTAALADEAFYNVDVSDLKLTEGKLPSETEDVGSFPWISYRSMAPYATLDGEGEAYVRPLAGQSQSVTPAQRATQDSLLIRVPAARKITGTLFWPKADWSGMVKVRFATEAAPSSEAKTEFAQAKLAHYRELLSQGIAGAAWFRHQVRELRRSAGESADRPEPGPANRNRIDSLDDTFDLLSGGRAISENLQLDRVLPPVSQGSQATVPLDSLKGISIAAIDWKPLIKEMKPATDPLAKLVPADQHLVLFPSFSALAQLGERLAQQGKIVLRLAQPQTSDARLVAHYERQLGLSLADLGKIAGSQKIGSVALTGSDPYFLSGTDVALVFETAEPDALKDKLLGANRRQGGQGGREGRGEGRHAFVSRAALGRPAGFVVRGGTARRGDGDEFALSNRAIRGRCQWRGAGDCIARRIHFLPQSLSARRQGRVGVGVSSAMPRFAAGADRAGGSPPAA